MNLKPPQYLSGLLRVLCSTTFFEIQSSLSKTDTFGTGTSCLSWRDVRLMERQIEGAKKGRDQLSVSVLQRCPSYGGVR